VRTKPAAPLDAIEHARALLGLTYAEIAAALSADETTLHRWRRGQSRPGPSFTRRLRTLDALLAALARTFPQDMAAGWLDAPLTPLAGRTPHELLVAGQGELLLGLLVMLAPADPAAMVTSPIAGGLDAGIPAGLEPGDRPRGKGALA
jgi:hypothetical protein